MSGYRSGGNVGRVVTRSNVAGSNPVGSVSVTGTAGTTSWGQVVSSLGVDSVITKVYVTCANDRPLPGGGNSSTVEVAIGGAGSEVVIATEPLLPTGFGASGGFFAVASLPVPLRVASGQRIAARATTPTACNGLPIAIDVYGVATANLETL